MRRRILVEDHPPAEGGDMVLLLALSLAVAVIVFLTLRLILW